MLFHTILLQSFHQLQEERSRSSIFHILKGKRSAQTIQDSKTFYLEQFFGIYKSLSRTPFELEVERLKENSYIQDGSNESLLIQEEGRAFLESMTTKNRQEIAWLNGFHYHHITNSFWNRLLLFIQTGSNKLKGESSFFPVIDDHDDIQWVRSYYHLHKESLDELFAACYQELFTLFQAHQSFHADIIVARLTGYRKIGWSKQQIATKWNLSIHDVELYIQASLHYVIRKIKENPSDYQVLQAFLPEKIDQLPLTKTARKTYDMLTGGWAVEDIATKRGLKINTIHDHIIEITYVDPLFSIRSFVSPEEERIILNTIQQLNTKRLKVIKEQLDDSITYFQIRLVMAKNYHVRGIGA